MTTYYTRHIAHNLILYLSPDDMYILHQCTNGLWEGTHRGKTIIQGRNYKSVEVQLEEHIGENIVHNIPTPLCINIEEFAALLQSVLRPTDNAKRAMDEAGITYNDGRDE